MMLYVTETTLNYFEKKVRYRGKRPEMTNKLAQMITDKQIEPESALRGLEILTRAFIYDKSSPYEEDCFDKEHVQGIARALCYIDELDKPAELAADEMLYTRSYLKKAEMLINEVDLTFPAESKQDKLFTFAECFLEMSNGYLGIPELALPYHGDTLKISANVYRHAHSVLILPNDPAQAVASLYGEPPRLLFAEYGGKESAETIVQEMYGTDGGYAAHYRAFLDCRDRYPGQKHQLG